MEYVGRMCSYYGNKVCDPTNCDADFCAANKADFSSSFDQFCCEYCKDDMCIKINEFCNELHCPLLKYRGKSVENGD